MKPRIKVGVFQNSPYPIQIAALRLSQFIEAQSIVIQDVSGADFVIMESEPQISVNTANNCFSIDDVGGNTVFTGDSPRSILAGVLYYIHHLKLGHSIVFPVKKTSPFVERLVMEDFPFMCYRPTGFNFDLDLYAENLVALGFTSMECNSFSNSQPMDSYHWNYAFTNPSPAYFAWTKWHDGVWDKELIEANIAELDKSIDTALKYGLTPTLTTFLPRPYPEVFFEKHPHLRGPKYQNVFMKQTNHQAVYCLNTDILEVQEFYTEVYSQIFDRYPQIGNLFFWHCDLGTTFYPDNQGQRGCLLFERVAGFHRMIQGLLKDRKMDAKVWFNPWGLDQSRLDEINKYVPQEVGFSIKDNPGLNYSAGTTQIKLGDATIVSPELGAIPLKIVDLAKKSGRDVCLAQYQDFSEDLDPVLSIPHPIMIFRKFKTLQSESFDYSSANWGILSPDISPVNLNQNVIREMAWGSDVTVFTELITDIAPSGFSDSQIDKIYKVWRCIDNALKIWPQFWGLRLQDSGLRLRWLVRPLVFEMDELSEDDINYFYKSQIYKDRCPSPFKAFLDITSDQGFEVANSYEDMVDLLSKSERIILDLKTEISEELSYWLDAQLNSIRTLRYFWMTYHNVFKFHSLKENAKVDACEKILENEIANTDSIISHLSLHPETIVISGKSKWGQCFGPDVVDDFKQKKELMVKELETLRVF